MREPGEESARPSTYESSYRKQAQQLKRLLAEKVLEVDFFQMCLAKSRGSTPAERRFWRDGIYDQIREVLARPTTGRGGDAWCITPTEESNTPAQNRGDLPAAWDDSEHESSIAEFIEEYYNRQRLHSALGYRPPEELEQQSEVSGQAESRSATLQFFENNENGKNETGVSELLTGEGDSTAVPFPRSHPMLEDTRTLSLKPEL